jgi:NADH:ubiquinone oxidoreductase subunit 6 (subunit J)
VISGLVLYALLAALAVAAAVVVATSRSVTRSALALGVVVLAAAGIVGIFANAPLVAIGLVLTQGGVIAAVYLVGHMVQHARQVPPPNSDTKGRRLVLCAAAILVVALGVIALTPGIAPTVAVQADTTAAIVADGVAADGESLTGLLVRRHLVSFSVIGFVLFAATLAIVESNRVDDPASSGEDT